MTHQQAMTSPYGEDWRGLRDGKEPPECDGVLVDPKCSECFAVVFTVEGSRHWWNHEGDGSPERMERIVAMRQQAKTI